jgi:hypothetical protein
MNQSDDETSFPVVFTCRDQDRPLANLGQLLMIPLLGVFGGLLVGAVIALPISGIAKLESVARAVAFFTVSALAALGLSYYAWLSYRKRLSAEFRIWQDRVELIKGQATKAVFYTEIKARHTIFHKISTGEPVLLIIGNDGQQIRLRHHDWTTADIDRALDRIATPVQLPSILKDVRRGATVLFEEPHGLARWRVISVGVAVLFGLLGLVSVVLKLIETGEFQIGKVIRAVAILLGVPAFFRWVRIYTSGGIEINRRGIRPADQVHGTEVLWSEIASIKSYQGGFELSGPKTMTPIRLDLAIANRAILLAVIRELAEIDIEWNSGEHE